MSNVNTDAAYKYIRNKILLGEYTLGSALKPHRLAAEIGVSRTPIRDALRLLETDGLVVMKPRLGARVTSLTIEEFSHLCSLRLALEFYAAGLAASNWTQPQLEELKTTFGSLCEVGERLRADPKNVDLNIDYERQDLRFHMVLLEIAQNPLIKNECTRIHLLDHLLSRGVIHTSSAFNFSTGDKTANLTEHEEILNAIERRDVHQARSAMERHLQPVVDHMIAALKHEVSYQRSALRKIQMIDEVARL